MNWPGNINAKGFKFINNVESPTCNPDSFLHPIYFLISVFSQFPKRTLHSLVIDKCLNYALAYRLNYRNISYFYNNKETRK